MNEKIRNSKVGVRVLSIIAMVLCVVGLCVFAEPVLGAGGGIIETFPGASVSLKINGTEFTGGTLKLKDGDTFTLSMNWDVDNNWKEDKLSGTFTYQLPNGFDADISTQTIQGCGSYSISGGTVSVTFNDEFMNSAQDRSVNINIVGTIDIEDVDPTIIIPGTDIGEIPVEEEKTYTLSVDKSHGKVTTNDDGSLETDFTIEVTAGKYDLTNIVISDEAYAYGISGAVLNIDWDHAKVEGADVVPGSSKYEDGIYYLTLDKLEARDTATITYHAKFSCDDPQGFQSYNNVAIATSAEGASDDDYDDVTVSSHKPSISKTGTFNKESKTVQWRVTITPNGNAVTIKDYIVGDETGLVNGSVYVGTSFAGIGGVIANLSYDQIKAGYTLPAEYKDAYAIYVIYETTVTDEYLAKGYTSVINHAEADNVNTEKEVAVVSDTIDKSCVSIDYSNGYDDVRVTWSLNFIFATDLVKDVTFSEDYDYYRDYYRKYWSNNFVSAECDDLDEALWDVSDDGKTITFKAGTPKGTYTMEYVTRYDMELNSAGVYNSYIDDHYLTYGADSVTNVLTRNDTLDSAWADAELTYPPYEKEAINESSNKQKKTAEWEVTLDLTKAPGGYQEGDTIYLYEYVPNDQKMVEVRLGSENGNEVILSGTSAASSGTIYKYDVTDVVNADQTIFYIKTELTDAAFKELNGGKSKRYENYVRFDIGEHKDLDWILTDQSKNPLQIISKTVDSKLTADNHAKYVITFNKDAIDLMPFADETTQTFTVVDTMGSALLFLPDTLEVRKNGGSWEKSTNYTYDVENNIVRFPNLLNKTKYEIRYECSFTMSGESLKKNGWNKVTVEGVPAAPDPTIEVKDIEDISGATSSVTKVMVLKSDSDTLELLPDAEFDLYISDADKTEASKDGGWTFVKTLTTDETGMTEAYVLTYDKVYKIVEKKAPEGYQKTSSPKYVVRVSKNSSEVAADYQAIFGDDITVTTEKDEISVIKITVPNTLKPKSAEVTLEKLVTGSLGDLTKAFNFEVMYTDAEGVVHQNAKVQLKSGETYTFTVLLGSKFMVKETDGTGYTTIYTVDDGSAVESKECTLDSVAADASVTFTNDKEGTPDTGISLDGLPYVLGGGLALLGILAMILRRRKQNQ